ncbi:hypothetical protein EKO27_g3411 [Xylaria grammica]|uniref:Thioester reductase (TE) domain-containing protein n=1 Tax=Xylaria grammica TaxID=363999 RepID=A0A439DBA6_9PEZI|nr:hypothetical protein EKO27_g3411 [Xylaria grammica]
MANRQAMIDEIIAKYKAGFTPPERPIGSVVHIETPGRCVLVTGATGSLGSHIAADLAQRPEVSEVVCPNRLSSTDASLRQQRSFEARGIYLTPLSKAKLNIIQTDTSKPLLGLPLETFRYLVERVTHVVHSAWPMSFKRSLSGYEQQFKMFRNPIYLASVVANYPTRAYKTLVPEQLVTSEAKMICEHILHETLYRGPDTFHAMAVRVAQVSGSTHSGHWNPTEYIAFLVKSSQTLGKLPDLDGTLSWYPADEVATTLGDLLMSSTAPNFIGHIENPARQSWRDTIETLASSLGISSQDIVPFEEWLAHVDVRHNNDPQTLQKDTRDDARRE